jgi:hypothetical protein
VSAVETAQDAAVFRRAEPDEARRLVDGTLRQAQGAFAPEVAGTFSPSKSAFMVPQEAF